MAIYRLYAGDDGQSHIEETSLADHPELGEAQAAHSINFREWPPGHFIDWHPAPRRQYIISPWRNRNRPRRRHHFSLWSG